MAQRREQNPLSQLEDLKEWEQETARAGVGREGQILWLWTREPSRPQKRKRGTASGSSQVGARAGEATAAQAKKHLERKLSVSESTLVLTLCS